MNSVYAVIEAGGTKFNCALIDSERQILVSHRIDTTTPEYTLGETIDFFRQQREIGYAFDTLGLACFGPLDLNPESKTYGAITKTPKPSWSNTPIVKLLSAQLDCQVKIDTDVNAAALAEFKWGGARKTTVSQYITVGTGVGVGVVINGQTLKGLIHPELGHMLIPAPEGISGQCPFHGNCVEGLASGKALSQIWDAPAQTFADDHPAWDIEARVLARLCHNLMVGFSPEKIAMGGGVMAKAGLLEKVIEYTSTSLAGYLDLPEGVSLNTVIAPPELGEHVGLYGALALILE